MHVCEAWNLDQGGWQTAKVTIACKKFWDRRKRAKLYLVKNNPKAFWERERELRRNLKEWFYIIFKGKEALSLSLSRCLSGLALFSFPFSLPRVNHRHPFQAWIWFRSLSTVKRLHRLPPSNYFCVSVKPPTTTRHVNKLTQRRRFWYCKKFVRSCGITLFKISGHAFDIGGKCIGSKSCCDHGIRHPEPGVMLLDLTGNRFSELKKPYGLWGKLLRTKLSNLV